MKLKKLFQRNKEKRELEEKFERFLDDIGGMMDLYRVQKDVWSKYNMQRDKANVVIKADKPIIILPIADMHIGHIAVNINQLLENWFEFLRSDNIYLILVGDYVEWFFSTRDIFGNFEQILTPDMQVRFFKKMIEIDPTKILAANVARGSQHDALPAARTGYSLFANIFGECGIPCLGNQGMINITLNDIEYKIASAHKVRYSSYHNANHAPHALMTRIFGGADCAVAAHQHTPAMQEQWYGGRTEHTIRCPTYKNEPLDRYSTKFWNTPRFLRHYCWVFYNDRKEIDTMRVEVAMQYIDWLEEKNKKK